MKRASKCYEYRFKDPRNKRGERELGRFGMGLKTAFSLGRRLSIIQKDNNYVERCWDLDYVSQCNEWKLFKNRSY